MYLLYIWAAQCFINVLLIDFTSDIFGRTATSTHIISIAWSILCDYSINLLVAYCSDDVNVAHSNGIVEEGVPATIC